MTLAPLSAHAQNAPIVTKDRPFDAYPSTYSSNPIRSWLDMVSASQAAQPSWMTPLVTVTPRLEQEFRWDVDDQKNGTGTQGNGQRLVNYGGPGGARVELIPAYNWEVILAPPPYVTASGPKGTGQGTGDWPMFLIKYRLLSANKDNGDYIVTAFFQMSDPSGTCCTISNNVLVAQPTLAFGKGWGDFDIQSTISQQYPIDSIGPKPKTGKNRRKFRRPDCLEYNVSISLPAVFLAGTGGQLHLLAQRNACRLEPGHAHARPHSRPLSDRQRHPDPAGQPDHRRRLPGGGDAQSGDAEQFCRDYSRHLLTISL
jgi:hypothetical protein